jgi:hypothetical protein
MCHILLKPLYISLYRFFNKLFSFAFFQGSAVIEQFVGFGEVDFGLLHHRHVQEDEALPQVVISPEGGDIAGGIAEDGGGLLVPHAAAGRAGTDIEGIFQDTGYGAVVFGCDEHNTVHVLHGFTECFVGFRDLVVVVEILVIDLQSV